MKQFNIDQIARPDGTVGHIAKHLLASRGDLRLALQQAEQRKSPPTVVDFFKAAVDAGSTLVGNWANSLADVEIAISGFISTLANASAFDRILPDMKQLPLRTRVIAATVGITGATIGEGQAKPIGSLQLSGTHLLERKAICLLVVSDELVRFSGDIGRQFLENELRIGLGVETDETFIEEISVGVTPTASAGTTAANSWTDIGVGLGALTLSAQSKIYLITTPTIATKLLTRATTVGAAGFTSESFKGGPISFEMVCSNAVPSGQMIFMDATQFAASPGTVELSAANQASVQMATPADSPPSASTVLTSFWQNNLTGLRAERMFGVEKLRQTAASIISGVA